jgi:hypothetical protein
MAAEISVNKESYSYLHTFKFETQHYIYRSMQYSPVHCGQRRQNEKKTKYIYTTAILVQSTGHKFPGLQQMG